MRPVSSPPDLDARWVAALPHPVVALDTDGRIIAVNPAAEQLLGRTSDELHGRHLATTALAETDQGGFWEVLTLVLGGVQWSGQLRLTTAHEAHVQVVPVLEAGMAIGALVTVDSVGARGGRAEQLSGRLTRLTRVAAELQSANDLETLTDVVVSLMADAAGATTASLSIMVDERTLALVGIRGGPTGAAGRWASYPADTSTPAGTSLIEGAPLLLSGRDTIHQRYPELELAAPGERSILCLPLIVADRRVGVATMSFPGRVEIDAAELEFFGIMSDTCAQALDRIRALETVRRQHAQLTFIAKASAELASSLDYEATLRSVARMAVPHLADWCAISLAQDGVLRTLAVAHRDPGKVALAMEFQERYPPSRDSGGYQVLSTGQSLLVPEITDDMLEAAAQDETHLRMLRELALHSGLTVPLRAGERVLGTITWINGATGRRFGPDDVSFGEDLGRRAGVAIDNALLHSELREVADRLQEAVLPAPLPELDGWAFGAHYRSSGKGTVGGDFYETIPLHDGRLALAIGDVMGRGVTAAAGMAQVRAALRALVAVDPDPQAVMTRLDLLYERFPSEQLVSMVYALVTPGDDLAVLSCAGHPPPLLARADGTVELLREATGRILGAGPSERCSIDVPFAAGETLLLFTDGLLERRDEDLAGSEARLVEAYRRLPPRPTAAELDGLVAQMRDPSRDDDVAVLAAHRLPR